ncbi:MAG TPA: hypothetical protein VNT26_07390, partial [Candidatus Sulfotelmatobacter sp.]|nr:hypothetical protein [Candidatus Sulfotelmatobacter sp.]
DVFDAVTSPRPYRKSMAWEEALAMLQIEGVAGRLDLRVIAALERLALSGRLPRKSPLPEIDQGFVNACAAAAPGD